MFLQEWFLPTFPQIKVGGGSTALFEENLSLICCSCRGPFGQLTRAGVGSFPNEVTTCYTWVGHLRGMVGHGGIWLSFPLCSAWGKHTAATGGVGRVYFLYLMSCPAMAIGPAAYSWSRRVSYGVVQPGIWEWKWYVWFAYFWGVINLFLSLCYNSVYVMVLVM